jgi:hypothetical protein
MFIWLVVIQNLRIAHFARSAPHFDGSEENHIIIPSRISNGDSYLVRMPFNDVSI